MTPEHTRFRTEIPRPSHLLLRSRVALAVSLLAAAALGVAARLEPDWLIAVDRPVSDWLRGDGTGQWLSGMITMLGSPNLTLPLAVAASLLLWKRCRTLAMTIPAMLTLGVVGDLLLKVVVARPRPEDPSVGTALWSFPSGHVIQAVLFFGLLPPIMWVLTESKRAFWASAALPLLTVPGVAYSRIALGAHWPSDVVASVLIGLLLLLVAELFAGSAWAVRQCDECPLHLSSDGDRSAPDRTPVEQLGSSP